MNLNVDIPKRNSTFNLLYPCVYYYGKDFIDYVNNFKIVAVGLDDETIRKNTFKGCLFILVKLEQSKKSDDFISWVKQQDYYMADYIYNAKLNYHMIVIDIPKECDNIYVNFLFERFEKMYKKEDLDKILHLDDLYKLPDSNIKKELILRRNNIKQILTGKVKHKINMEEEIF